MTHTPATLQSSAPRFSMTGRMVAMSPGEDGLIGIPFPEHSNELLSRLNAQRRLGLLCDLTLTSRGARYPTHRAVMAAVSLYFRRLFGAEDTGGVGEVSGGCSVCQLDCVSPDALDALLEFAYTATLTIRSSDMREVLEGAQLLGIQCVADACRHILGEAGEAGEVHEVDEVSKVIQESRVIKERKAPSRRKQDRRNVEKAASPMCAEWRNTGLEDNTPTYEAPPTPECKPNHSQNGSSQQGALMNGSHWGPPPVKDEPSEDEELHCKGRVVTQSHTPSQVDTVMGGTTEGATKKRKPQTPQQCPVCQKIIHGAGKLPRHMRTHTGEKPFQCSACGVRFTRNDKLKIHMRKHTGERPYSCPSCPARFLHSYDLKNHLSLHSGTRPYECPLCHKAFTREDHLQRHRKGLACLELRPRRPRHTGSPHSPLAAPTAAGSHFLYREDAETLGGVSLGTGSSPIPGEMAYPRVLHWRTIEERESGSRRAVWREDEVPPKK